MHEMGPPIGEGIQKIIDFKTAKVCGILDDKVQGLLTFAPICNPKLHNSKPPSAPSFTRPMPISGGLSGDQALHLAVRQPPQLEPCRGSRCRLVTSSGDVGQKSRRLPPLGL